MLHILLLCTLTGFVLCICGLLLLCFVGAGFGLNSKYLGVSGSVSPQLVVSPPLDSFSFQLFIFYFIFNDIFIFWLWTWILGTGGSILILVLSFLLSDLVYCAGMCFDDTLNELRNATLFQIYLKSIMYLQYVEKNLHKIILHSINIHHMTFYLGYILKSFDISYNFLKKIL